MNDRHGQRLLSLPVVAGCIMATVGLTAIVALQFHPWQAGTVSTQSAATSSSNTPTDQKRDATAITPPPRESSVPPAAPRFGGSSAQTPVSTSPITDSRLMSKQNLKKAAVYGAMGAAATYQTLDQEQRQKLQKSALGGATSALHNWNGLSPEAKQSFKQKTATVSRQAFKLWHRLPDQ